ncbi:MAG: hypothetical protein JXB50_08075 [Spirochaetes bacterium]|nr:hypothetical protein [Spirochaetota bacterium]
MNNKLTKKEIMANGKECWEVLESLFNKAGNSKDSNFVDRFNKTWDKMFSEIKSNRIQWGIEWTNHSSILSNGLKKSTLQSEVDIMTKYVSKLSFIVKRFEISKKEEIINDTQKYLLSVNVKMDHNNCKILVDRIARQLGN